MTVETKETLIHNWAWSSDPSQFFEEIDRLGGWPWNAKSVVLNHGTERECYFSKSESVRNEMNTSIATADEYYLWKLSAFSKEKIRKEVLFKIGQEIMLRGSNK